jgi:RiboL-PSP-HEPN
MASPALTAFRQAISEISDLERADPTPFGGKPTDPAIARALGRARVVLLSSHFERYIYAINEEATQHAAAYIGRADDLPAPLRLLHTQPALDSLLETGWDKRASKLADFMVSDGWLWTSGTSGPLEHQRLLLWMKAPTPKNLVRYYRYWGIENIFESITRASHTRRDLWLRLEELVSKRNNVAHGDATVEATPADLRLYQASALRFCERADRQLAKTLRELVAVAPPW